MLKHKRVGYTGEEVSRPETLTLLEIIPGLPPAGAVGVVDPLTLATGEVREALFDPSLVRLPEAERVGVRPARVLATDEEWNKIGAELLQRGVEDEIACEEAPIVDGQPVLVGAIGVEKRGTPLPPATRVLRLIVNAIPSNKQQTSIKGDTEQTPVGSEWLHIALETDVIVLWSSDDIQECFHVSSLPPAWRRWMILSKPIRVAMPAGGAGVLTSKTISCVVAETHLNPLFLIARRPGGDTRCPSAHRQSLQRWSVVLVLQVWRGYKGAWTSRLAS